MNKYKIVISDRKRARLIALEQGGRLVDAIAAAIGERCYGLPVLESWTQNGDMGTYQATIRTGRTVGGATPVKNIWVNAYLMGGA
jgi:hypothetical protein